MEVTNIRMKGSWEEVVDDCRFTWGKGPLGKEPSKEFKQDILIAEHSPIRDIHIKFDFLNLGSCFITHYVRHKWEPFVKSQRTDLTGFDRHNLPQDAPNDMRGDANIQNLIDTSRKRLCFKASKETREAWETLKYKLHKIQPEIADVMVPNCVYRCGCPEGKRMCEAKMCEKWLPTTLASLTSISERYQIYNDWLYKRYDKKLEEEK